VGNLYLKGIDPSHSQSRGIADFGSLGQELGQLEKPPNRVRFKEILGAKSPAKEAQGPHTLHTTRISQEIILKTPFLKSQQRTPKITKKEDRKGNTRA
jgi:hypothetical protein